MLQPVDARLRIPPSLGCGPAAWGAAGLLWPPFTPRPGVGARLLDLGLFWPPCEELGPRACVSRAFRPALGPAEAIRSHWQPVLASCCPWWRVRLLQGKSCPNRLSCRDRKKTTISLPGIPSAAEAWEEGPSLCSSGGVAFEKNPGAVGSELLMEKSLVDPPRVRVEVDMVLETWKACRGT